MKYFKTEEFVSRVVYGKFGNSAIKFIDVDIIIVLTIIRETLDKPITINDWLWNGKFQQRGLRSNIDGIPSRMTKQGKLYLSAHVLGKAVDFDVEGMTALEVRNWIVNNADLFPCKIRLEKGVNWVHLDIIDEDKNPKIYKFNP